MNPPPKNEKEFENVPAVNLDVPNELLEISSTAFRETLPDVVFL
jgi:hypothetical protein